MQDRSVLGVLPQGTGEQDLRGLGVAEIQEGVPEAEGRPWVVRRDFEDRLEEGHRLIRMSVPPELLRLLHDVPRFRGLEAERLP